MKCWKCQNEITTMDGITGALICRKCFEGEMLEEHLGPLKEMELRFTVEEIKSRLMKEAQTRFPIGSEICREEIIAWLGSRKTHWNK